MPGHLFIAPGDITQLAADAIAYSTSTGLTADGSLYASFRDHVGGFVALYRELHDRHGSRCSVGDAFWLPLRADRRPYGIVVSVATGRKSPSEDKAGLAVRAAVDHAVEHLRELRGSAERLLIALPAFRVGRGGDRRDRLRSARAQVASALEALERHPNIDLVFVTYTPSLYQIFLEARRQLISTLGGGPALPPELAAAILARECVLFVGAGLSRGAGLPDWNELISRLARDLEVPRTDRLDYLDLAQWYRERFGDRALAEVIRATFADPARPALPTLAHYLLLSLPVRIVVTTNYDDLLERALTALKRPPVQVIKQADVASIAGSDGVHVVKLHGDAGAAEEIVLSRDDYDQFFERRPAFALLLEGLLLNQTFFFAGYGLRDPNFRQLFNRIARMLSEARRPAFATTFEGAGGSGAYLIEQWRRKQLHLIDVPGATRPEQELRLLLFLDRLAEHVALHAPGLVLAPDVEVAPPLAHLRDLLAEQVGAELEAVAKAGLESTDRAATVRFLSDVLEFLTAHGWRPGRGHGWDLCRLWEHLADHAADPGERHRLLLAALDSAESFTDVQRVRERIKKSGT